MPTNQLFIPISQEFMGYVFVPFAWLLGIEEGDCKDAGELLAQKILINEYFAYASLSDKIRVRNNLGLRSMV